MSTTDCASPADCVDYYVEKQIELGEIIY